VPTRIFCHIQRRQLKEFIKDADPLHMTAPIANICDPRFHDLEDSIREAKSAALASMRFESNLARFLQMQCIESRVNLPLVFRGLELLGQISEERRLVACLRPFLRSTEPRIASKAVLVAGRRVEDLKWLIKAINETDDRTRANLIESVWGRRNPGIQELLMAALKDRNQRVAANAVYGLYLLGSEQYPEGLIRLNQSKDPLFRRAAIWVIRSVEGVAGVASLKPFILDPDPDVRHSAFQALIHLRENGDKGIVVPQKTGNTDQPPGRLLIILR
jgi:hypothetical protein